eukprot:Nk52_evm21s2496 gene=Nk52_evmTU21s2496
MLAVQAGSAKSNDFCGVLEEDSVPCEGPANVILNEKTCVAQGCCWRINSAGYPSCYTSKESCDYFTASEFKLKPFGAVGTYKLDPKCKHTIAKSEAPIDELTLEVHEEDTTRLRVVIADSKRERHTVPEFVFKRPNAKHMSEKEFAKKTDQEKKKIESEWRSGLLYEYTIKKGAGNGMGLVVTRKSNNEVIFDSTSFKFIFQDQLIRMTTVIGNDKSENGPKIYGLGERVLEFKLPFNKHRNVIFARDKLNTYDENVYGAHPYYIESRVQSKRSFLSHATLFMNSHPMEVTVDEKSLTWNVLGGIVDITVFLGPEPTQLTKQYQELVGRPKMIPFWSLGFHIARYGWPTIQEPEDVVAKMYSHAIPFECLWFDIDYMDDFQDFTFSEKKFPRDRMKRLVDTLHNNQQKIVFILDPGLSDHSPSFDRAMHYHVNDSDPHPGNRMFLLNSTGGIHRGKVWPGAAAYPDFVYSEKARNFWMEEIAKLYESVPFDGLWLDMNDPSDFCHGADAYEHTVYNPEHPNSFDDCHSWPEPNATSVGNYNYEYPPYLINNGLSSDCDKNKGECKPWYLMNGTISMKSTHTNGEAHIKSHNLYGHAEGMATADGIDRIYKSEERSFVLSRGTFPGSGKYVSHWLGDNESTWKSMKKSISGVLSFQLFGVPHTGADICGFWPILKGSEKEELCSRWTQMGAFYPYSRNHHGDKEKQYPYMFEKVEKSTKKYMKLRYELLSYMYTVFARTSCLGEMFWRPLWYEFEIADALDIYNQFMVGHALLVTPVLEPDVASVDGVLPTECNWFDLHTLQEFERESASNEIVKMDAPWDTTPVFIKGGSVLTLHEYRYTTSDTRLSPMTAVAALYRNSAKGDIYIDDGSSVRPGDNFSYMNQKVSVEGELVTVELAGVAGYTGEFGRVTALKLAGIGKNRKDIHTEKRCGRFEKLFYCVSYCPVVGAVKIEDMKFIHEDKALPMYGFSPADLANVSADEIEGDFYMETMERMREMFVEGGEGKYELNSSNQLKVNVKMVFNIRTFDDQKFPSTFTAKKRVIAPPKKKAGAERKKATDRSAQAPSFGNLGEVKQMYLDGMKETNPLPFHFSYPTECAKYYVTAAKRFGRKAYVLIQLSTGSQDGKCKSSYFSESVKVVLEMDRFDNVVRAIFVPIKSLENDNPLQLSAKALKKAVDIEDGMVTSKKGSIVINLWKAGEKLNSKPRFGLSVARKESSVPVFDMTNNDLVSGDDGFFKVQSTSHASKLDLATTFGSHSYSSFTNKPVGPSGYKLYHQGHTSTYNLSPKEVDIDYGILPSYIEALTTTSEKTERLCHAVIADTAEAFDVVLMPENKLDHISFDHSLKLFIHLGPDCDALPEQALNVFLEAIEAK